MLVVQKCKHRATSRYDKRGSKWCHPCGHWTVTDTEHKCQCCLGVIGNEKKLTELLKFDRILRECEVDILKWMSNPSTRDYEFGWPVKLGIISYFVPVRYLAEYYELPNLEGEDKYDRFLRTVKKECAVLPRYMFAIK